MATCSAPDCSRPVKSRSMCGTHHQRFRRTGSVGTAPIGPAHNLKGRPPVDLASYHVLHHRLRAERGPAKTYACTARDCQRVAEHWAYQHNDPDEVIETIVWNGRPVEVAYSLDLANYAPLCRSHSVQLDRWGKAVA